MESVNGNEMKIILEEKKVCTKKIAEIDVALKNLILKIISSFTLVVSTSIVASMSEKDMLWSTTTGFISLILTQFMFLCISYIACLMRMRKTCVAEVRYYSDKLNELGGFNLPIRYSTNADFNLMFKKQWVYYYKFIAFLSISAFFLLSIFTIVYMRWSELYRNTYMFFVALEIMAMLYLWHLYKKTNVDIIHQKIIENEKTLILNNTPNEE